MVRFFFFLCVLLGYCGRDCCGYRGCGCGSCCCCYCMYCRGRLSVLLLPPGLFSGWGKKPTSERALLLFPASSPRNKHSPALRLAESARIDPRAANRARIDLRSAKSARIDLRSATNAALIRGCRFRVAYAASNALLLHIVKRKLLLLFSGCHII